MKKQLEQLVKDAVFEMAPNFSGAVSLERPKDVLHGDWTTNVSFVLAKELGKSPMDIAGELAERIEKSSPAICDTVEAAGGYVNCTLSPSTYVEIVEDSSENAFTNNLYVGKKIVVEYTQPNPFKPFHIGHLMSNTIGESLARIIEAAGADVVRANYQGDVGPHVAKALWALQQWGEDASDVAMIGKAYAHGHAMSEDDPDVKAEIARINRAVYEKSDEVLMHLYAQGRETTLEHFEEIYKILGTTFDQYYFEGDVWEDGKRIVMDHVGDVFEESDGAIIFPGEKYGLHTRVFITQEGLPTYEAKEVGLAFQKHKNNDADLYVFDTATEQASYFQVVKKAIELTLPEMKGKMLHVAHGMMQLTDGKMSSRKGNVVTGEELIDEARAVAEVKISERADAEDAILRDQIAVGGLKFSILKQAIGKNIVYDADAALSFEGDAGPYLQYTHARACSVLAKAKNESTEIIFDPKSIEIVRLIDRYQETVENAGREYAPHLIAQHLLQIARAYNAFYAEHKMLSGDAAESYRVALTKKVAATIKKGLSLLGIAAPERM